MSDVREEIYFTHKKAIFNYFYKTTMNYHTSEDLTEDTFLRAFRFFSSFRGESSVKTWLFKIARNVLSTYLASSRSKGEDAIEDSVPDNENAYTDLEKRLAIKKVMESLSEDERTLIMLRDVNGFSYLEISKIMNFTEGQVKIGIHRARKKFKEIYLNESEVE